jgi:hypothetical protein
MLFALQRRPQPLVGEVLYHPLGDQEIGELGQAPPGERQPVLSRRGLGELLDLPPLAQRELRQMPPAYLGYSESRPSALKLRSTSRTRSSLVNAGRAICATLIPCADHDTICIRRHVTSGPVPRRTIRRNRLPSSSPISRTRTRPARQCEPMITQPPGTSIGVLPTGRAWTARALS